MLAQCVGCQKNVAGTVIAVLRDKKPRKKRGPDKQPKKKQTLKTKTPEERQAFRDKKAAKGRPNEEEKAGSFNNAEDSQKHKHGYETPTNMQARLDSESSQKRMKLGAEMRKLEKQKSYLEYFPQIE